MHGIIYNMEHIENKFNHELANVADTILVVGELCHIQRHALRSMVSPNIEEDERTWYAVVAKQAKDLRRKYMRNHFADCPDELWCLGKASASLRQLNYETFTGDIEECDEIDALVDSIWSKITGQDMTGCKSCSSDREEGSTSSEASR